MEELYQKRYVGGSYPIHDAWDKVSGAMIYTGDMQIPGMYHVRLLFSDVPRARIKKIHTEAAEAQMCIRDSPGPGQRAERDRRRGRDRAVAGLHGRWD